MIVDKMYFITIFSMIQTNNKQISKSQITAPCEVEFRNKPYLIAYKEIIDGTLSSHSVIKIYSDNLIIISRNGDHLVDFIFEKDKNHKCSYITKFALIELKIFTHKIIFKIEKDSCYIELVYSISSNGLIFSKNKIVINVKEENDNV